MNPVILYPKTAAQAKLFRETAEKQGVEIRRISEKSLEDFDDWLFGAKLFEISKTAKNVSEEKVLALFDRKLRGL